MSPVPAIPQSCLLGEVGKLISDEATDAIDRMIALANGELLPSEQVLPNAQRPTPNTATERSSPVAWITKGGHAYYYKTHRIGAKVRSIYFGKGEEAQIIARADEALKYAAKLRAEQRIVSPPREVRANVGGG